MDGQRFDNLARVLSASLNRKGFLAVLAGIAAPAALGDDGAAKKRKSRGRGSGGEDIAPEGIDGAVCSGSCSKTADCPESPGCICDPDTNRCNTVVCGGQCLKDSDCQDLPGCSCLFEGIGPEDPGYCGTETCSYFCNKGECSSGRDVEGDSCVCDFNTDFCVTISCPGFCQDAADCAEQGQDGCACFLGNDVDVAAVSAEGADPTGSCGACLGAGAACDASTECCGQLVCGGGGGVGAAGLTGGTCRHKPKPRPKDRCHKHGHSCRRDNDCCAQAICYKGTCGEKDTHCKNDSECASGYRCQGGPLSPGHRRCRKNGRRNRNRRNKNGNKR